MGIAVRGEDERSEGFFSYIPVERRIPADHPLRAIRTLTEAALAGLSRDFDRLYARDGRPSIPPERLLRALLLQAFYTVRSERQLMEQLDYNLLFRWFVGSRPTIRSGMPRCSARTAIGCSAAISRPSSLPAC
jgi:transposase